MSVTDRLRAILAGDDPGSALPTFEELRARAARSAGDGDGDATRGQDEPGEEEIEPTDEFELALALVRERPPFVLVMGQAGTGKTTLIRWLRRQLDGNVVVVAPTGLAALGAGGQTIHSFFGFPPRRIEPEDIGLRRARAVYEKLDLLVIDEISMVSCDLLDAIDRFLRVNRRQLSRRFGGVPVVALGDLFQLPPVVRSEDRRVLGEHYDSYHFFAADCLKRAAPVTLELTRPFRQDDAHFLSLLRAVRRNSGAADAIEELNRRCLDAAFEDRSWLVVVPTRARAEAINSARLAELPGRSRRYTGEITGRFLGARGGTRPPDPAAADKQLPAPYRLDLKPGARVIFTRNDAGRRWVNGTMGTVRRTAEASVLVDLDDARAGAEGVRVRPVRWTKSRYVLDRASKRIVLEEVGAFSQLPLAPAWAITIHKVQGQTLARLVVDLDAGAFAAGQTYVAISRCRSLDGLRLKRPIRPQDVACDPAIDAFVSEIEGTLVNRVLAERDAPPAGEPAS